MCDRLGAGLSLPEQPSGYEAREKMTKQPWGAVRLETVTKHRLHSSVWNNAIWAYNEKLL